MEDGHLVGQDNAHIGAEGLHILAEEDSVLLGVIPVGLKMSREFEHRVLQDMGRIGRIVLKGRLWWWGDGRRSTLGVYRETKPGLILSKLILVLVFIAGVINHF